MLCGSLDFIFYRNFFEKKFISFFSVLFLFVNDQQTHYYSHELMMRIIIKIPARHTYMIILCFIRINHSILSLQIQLASVILIINKHVNHTNFVVYILRKICPKKRFSHTQTHTHEPSFSLSKPCKSAYMMMIQ